ncbi:MAG: LuxR C-terminal-related transcriptional regulator [Sporichthyaceae bacterium]
MSLPVGTVTFLLTDVEGSTSGWQADRAAMAAAVVRHYEILDAAVRARRGTRPVEQGEGDSVVAVFPLASDALRAAVDIQLALDAEPWPDGGRLAVRIALHTGEAQLRDAGNYMGNAVIRTARLRAIGHGGQILCSHATADVAGDALPDGVTLLDLGAHRLKDLARAEHTFQVCHPSLRREFPPLRSLDAIPNNLPVYLTSFIGREAELADLSKLAGQYRLVTLTGSGGVGKTRLAARVAAEVATTHRDGAWWVELAPLANPELVTETVLDVLAVADIPGSSPLQRLAAHLATRELALVLDNCEHVLEAAAGLVEVVLRSCPGVTVLATSREPLAVGGEISWQVPPLAMPDPATPPAVESLSSYDAVQLFVDRAVRARPNFAVTNDTAAVVAEICARLDGIPLAIELAAARVRVLTPQQILDGLQDRFRMLTGGGRVMPRQQTLEASVAWSYDLLSADEQLLFRRLSVFAGWTIDAAEFLTRALGSEPASVLDLLDGLVAKSLVVLDAESGPAARYRMLETMRAFAKLMLARAEETGPARDAHLACCLDSLRTAERALVGVTATVITTLSADQDNYRTALDWALAADDVELALDLAWRDGVLLLYRGRHLEGRHGVERALARPGGTPAGRAAAVWGLGFLQWCLADLPGFRKSAAQIRALVADLDNPRLHGRAGHLQALLNLFVDPALAPAEIAAARPFAEQAEDHFVLMDLAWDELFLAARADNLGAAEASFRHAQSLAETHDNDWFRTCNTIYASIAAIRAGDLPRGREHADAGIRVGRGLGEVQGVGFGTGALAEIELLEGSADRALALVGPAVRDCTEAAAHVALVYVMAVHGRALAALADPAARSALEGARRVAGEVGDDWQTVQASLALAHFLVANGELAPVEELLTEIRGAGARMGSPWPAAVADHVAGLVATASGAPDRAEDLHHAALAVHIKHGYALDVVDCLEVLAARAAGQESYAESVRLLAATARRRTELGYRHGRTNTAPAEASTREGLGDDAFAAAWAEGEALDIDQAVAYARRARGERKRPSTGWASLTPTELEIARLAAQGLSNAEIGARAFITGGTVKIHLSHIYTKLDLTNRAQLTAEATRRGI